MSQNKKILIFLSLITFLIVVIVMVTYDKNISFLNMGDQGDKTEVEYSDEYKKWLEISENEKNSCIAPSQYENNDEANMLATNVSGALNLNASSFEEKFSLKDLIPENLVFLSQGGTSLCWGFTANRALETNLALNDYYNGNTSKVYDFSQRHMDYATSRYFKDGTNTLGYYRNVGVGGYDNMVYSYLTNGMGAILEEDMPFENNKNQLYLSSIQNKTVATRVYDIDRYSYSSLNDEGMLAIKNHIKKYGAVATSNYYRSSAINWNTCAAYNTNGSLNHAIALIGWDDNYSRTNFKSSQRPSKDGAWIAINSVSSCPILYISYYDSVVNDDLYGISKATTDVNYDNIYQYDWYGPSKMYYVSSPKLFLGNIYERTTSDVEYLTDVSIYAAETYKVKVYVNPNGTSMDKENLQQVKLKAGDYETFGHGYHTLEFATPIKLSSDSFAVVLEIESDGTRTYYYNEEMLSSSGIYKFVKNSGKAYYSKSDVFNDSSKWTKDGADNTIKAFTISGIKKLTLKANPKKTSYIEGENFNSLGMVIEAIYSNGKTKIITDYTISSNKNLSVNQNSVKITYLNQSLNVPISVEKNTVSDLYITSGAKKTSYIEGEDFDSSGMVVTAVYKNGTKKQITNYELINATNLSVDQAYVTVSYSGKQINQQVTVSEKEVENISVKMMPNKLEYGLNSEQLDLSGGILLITYNNGETEEILMTDEDILVIGFDNSLEGKNKVELIYKRKSIEIVLEIVEKNGAINSNLVYGVCNIQEITMFDSQQVQDSYAEMKIEVSHIMRDMTNESFEYYYYLSSEMPTGIINDWTKISEEQLESDKLNFTINTKNIEDVESLKNYETLNLYIKEVATKNKISNEAVVKLVLPVAEENMDSSARKNNVGIYIVLIIVVLAFCAFGYYFFKMKKRNNQM